MELFVADAFTTRRFSGNQAGVALLGEADFPEEGFMRALAGELKHSETAFVRRTGEGSFHIRYFTPAEEVDLCGHATIASFTVLRERRAIGPGTYALHTRSGDLSIQVGADAVWMDMAPPADGRSFSEEEQAELYAAYGLSLADRPEGLEAQAVSTGLLDILLPVRDLAALERAEQNEGEVTRLSERYGVVGVHMFCPSTPDAAAHCRNFAPPVRHPGGGGHRHLQRGADLLSVPPGADGRRGGEPLCPGGEDGQALGDPQPSHGRGRRRQGSGGRPGGARPAV